jgi:hypothetical protein
MTRTLPGVFGHVNAHMNNRGITGACNLEKEAGIADLWPRAKSPARSTRQPVLSPDRIGNDERTPQARAEKEITVPVFQGTVNSFSKGEGRQHGEGPLHLKVVQKN